MIIAQQGYGRVAGGGDARAEQFAALLQNFYEDLLVSGVPERMAALVRQISEGSVEPDRAKKIALVAESDDELRSLAATLLEETDLAVVECTSAEAALAVLQRQGERVAFVFADEVLAGPRDGLDLARSAATLWPHVHVVLTTGEPDRDALPDGVRALQKPWRGLDVLLAAETALAANETSRS
jgi:CheY-like chemotaxis protein